MSVSIFTETCDSIEGPVVVGDEGGGGGSDSHLSGSFSPNPFLFSVPVTEIQ